MHIARIKNGIVKNLEVASESWLQSQNTDEYTFVVYDPSIPFNLPRIGATYDHVTGEFEQPSGAYNVEEIAAFERLLDEASREK